MSQTEESTEIGSSGETVELNQLCLTYLHAVQACHDIINKIVKSEDLTDDEQKKLLFHEDTLASLHLLYCEFDKHSSCSLLYPRVWTVVGEFFRMMTHLDVQEAAHVLDTERCARDFICCFQVLIVEDLVSKIHKGDLVAQTLVNHLGKHAPPSLRCALDQNSRLANPTKHVPMKFRCMRPQIIFSDLEEEYTMPYALAYLYSLMGFKVLFKNAFEEAHGKEKGEKVYKEHYGNSHDKTVKICTILSRSRDICRKDLLLDKLFTLIRRSMQQNISLPESVAETIHLHL